MSKQEEGGKQVITRRGFLGALLGVVAGFAGRRSQSAQAATAEPPLGSYIGLDGLALESVEAGYLVNEEPPKPRYASASDEWAAYYRYIGQPQFTLPAATLPLENGTIDTLGTGEKFELFIQLYQNGAIDHDTLGLLIHGSRSRWKRAKAEIMLERQMVSARMVQKIDPRTVWAFYEGGQLVKVEEMVPHGAIN